MGALVIAKSLWERAGIPETLAPGSHGWRRHRRDPTSSFYTFAEWIAYVDECGWGSAIDGVAILLAKVMWARECLPEPAEDEVWPMAG